MISFLFFRVWEQFDERIKRLNCGQVFYNHKKLNLPTFERKHYKMPP